MREINTLLELWKFRCEHYVYTKNENNQWVWVLDHTIRQWKDKLRSIAKNNKEKNKDLSGDAPIVIDLPCGKFALPRKRVFATESLLQQEPFTSKILHALLTEPTDFRKIFSNGLGINICDVDINVEESNNGNEYDISFKDNDGLLGIIENKITAPFSAEDKGKKHQLKRYYDDLKNSKSKKVRVLTTLTKYYVDLAKNPDENVKKIAEESCKGNASVLVKKIYWYQIVDLLEKIPECQRSELQKEALALFTSRYFLLQDSGCAISSQRDLNLTAFSERIKKICGKYGIDSFEWGNFNHRCITLSASKCEKPSWYGHLLSLNIWFDGYAVTGVRTDGDADCPQELKHTAYPFFDIVLKCYYKVKDDSLDEDAFESKKELLLKAGYRDYCVFYEKSRKIKQKLLRKSIAEQMAVGDTQKLLDQAEQCDPNFWSTLEKEISDWQKIVCDKSSSIG